MIVAHVSMIVLVIHGADETPSAGLAAVQSRSIPVGLPPEPMGNHQTRSMADEPGKGIIRRVVGSIGR